MTVYLEFDEEISFTSVSIRYIPEIVPVSSGVETAPSLDALPGVKAINAFSPSVSKSFPAP